MRMDRVFLLVDNMRIGGFQRLALDQAYGLSESGYMVTILVLDDLPTIETPSFIDLENDLIRKLQIEFLSLGNSRRIQLIRLLRLISNFRSSKLILSHSLSATFLIFIAAALKLKFVKVITTIHQLPTLSAPRQRLQRFLYAQFTWKLLAYSYAVLQDWNSRYVRSRSIFWFKEINLLRNGVYLKRLPSIKRNSDLDKKPRLIFLGRNTSWKGIVTFLKIAGQPLLKEFEILIMIPRIEDLNPLIFDRDLSDRITIVAGKTLSSFEPRFGDVHLYPANYGDAAKYIESVSLNCLEFACLGIPTLLTQGGLGTWPDLLQFQIFHETDWRDFSQVSEKICSISRVDIAEEDIQSIASIISINQFVGQIHSLIA